MNEPRRWLDISRALSPAERRVLVAGQTSPVPAGAKAAVKFALLAQLAAPSSVAAAKAATLPLTAPTTAVVSVVARVTLLKFMAAGFALGLAGSAVTSASLSERTGTTLRSAAPTPSSLPSDVVPGIDAERFSTPPQAQPQAEPQATPSPAPATAAHRSRPIVLAAPSTALAAPSFSASSVPAQNPQLRAMIDESSRLARARALLRNNAPRDALEVLDGMRRDHPHGALVQERQILTIEGLGSVGDAGAAAAAARDFLERYPTSPHVGSARRALKTAPPP